MLLTHLLRFLRITKRHRFNSEIRYDDLVNIYVRFITKDPI